jgi:hypothetical protein
MIRANMKVWQEKMMERDHLENLSADRSRMNLGERGLQGVDSTHVICGRGSWPALLNTVMNLGFQKMLRIS